MPLAMPRRITRLHKAEPRSLTHRLTGFRFQGFVANRIGRLQKCVGPSLGGGLFTGTNMSAFRGSGVHPSLIAAYLGTHYHISSNPRFILRIGQQSDELVAVYREYSLSTSAVLTAWNPRSEPHSKAENDIVQAELISEIDRLALRQWPAHGVDPTGNWPPEQSRFLLGATLDVVCSLAHRFGQNGIVWARSDAVPRLLLVC